MLRKLFVLTIALMVGFNSTINIRAMEIDTTAPIVIGVEEGAVYSAPVTIDFNEGVALLNDVEIADLSVVSEVGVYHLVVTDTSGNFTEVNFTMVDNTDPVVEGVVDQMTYTDPVTITFNEGTATLDGSPFTSGTTVNQFGTHQLVVCDEYTNCTTVNFTLAAKTAVVSGLKVTPFNYNTLSLNWDAISNVTGYEIWRSTGTSATYAKVVDVATNAYQNIGLGFNTRYNYKVRIYTLVNNVRVYGGFSLISSAVTALSNPTTKVENGSYNSLKVSWTPVSGASGYLVYRATSANGTYAWVATVTTTSYTNTSLTTDREYFYKVIAYKTVSTYKVYGGYSNVASARPLPSTVSASLVSTNFDTLQVKWPAVSGASGYEVHQASAIDGDYTLVTTITTTSYNFTSLPLNVNVFVKVRAFRVINGKNIYGEFSPVVSEAPVPNTPVLALTMLGFDSLKLTWAAIPGAEGYEVYKVNGNDKQLLIDTTNLELTDSGLTSGVNQVYEVYAYKFSDTTKVYSKKATISGVALPSTVVLSSVVNYTSIQLNWNMVAGADGYEVYRAASATGVYTLVATTEINGYLFSNLLFYSAHYYKVRAFKIVNDVKVYGSYSTVLGIRTSVAAPVISVKSIAYNAANISWLAVPGATAYEISRATSANGTFTVIVSSTKALTYNNSGLWTNSKYYYRVRSYKLVGTTKYYSKYSVVESAVIVPAAVTNPVFSNIEYDQARLSWTAVAGATGYEVFTALTIDGEYVLKTTSTTPTVIVSGLFTNVNAYAKVRAYRQVGSTKVYGNFSGSAEVKPIPSQPQAKVTSLGYDTLEVSWAAVSGADGYEVSQLNNSDYELKQDDNRLSFTINGLTCGVNQAYKVVAYRLIEGVKIYSAAVNVSGTPIPATPILKSTFTYNSVSLAWEAINGATGYEVWRATSATGVYTQLIDKTDVGYQDINLPFNTTYYYKVKAYSLADGRKVSSELSTVITAKTNVNPPAVKAEVMGYNSIKLTWESIVGATGYEVARATSLTGTYTVLSYTTATNYTSSSLLTNTNYFYRVRAYKTVGTVKYYSSYQVVNARPIPSIPTLTSVVSKGYDSINATWAAVPGASGYEVYIATQPEGTYTLRTTTKLLSYTIPTLITNCSYYVKVRVYTLVGTTKVYSGYSEVKTATPVPAAPVLTLSTPDQLTINLSWTASPGASGYKIFRLNQTSGEFELLTATTYTIYQDTNLPGNITQTYKIIPYVNIEELVILGDASNAASLVPSVNTPVITSVKSINSESLLISWQPGSRVTKYFVYRGMTADSTVLLNEVIIEAGQLTEYYDRTAVVDTDYFYQVKACGLAADGITETCSNKSLAVKGRAILNVPNITHIYRDSTSEIQLIWDEVYAKDGFEVYRSTSATGTYTKVATITENYYLSSYLTANTTYYFKIRTYKLVNGVMHYSTFTPVKSQRTAEMISVSISMKTFNYGYQYVEFNITNNRSKTLKTDTVGLYYDDWFEESSYIYIDTANDYMSLNGYGKTYYRFYHDATYYVEYYDYDTYYLGFVYDDIYYIYTYNKAFGNKIDQIGNVNYLSS